MAMPLTPQSVSVPIGSFAGPNGKPVPVYVNPAWFRYLNQQVYDRLGGALAPTIQEVNDMPRSTMVEDDEEGEEFFIPGPKGEGGEIGARGPATFLLHEPACHDRMPMLPGALLEMASLGMESGKYTPTLFNIANLGASTAYEWLYLRVGKIVIGGGRVDVDPTAAATDTQLGFTLPVASAIAAAQDCSGVAFASGIAGQGAAVLGDAANTRGLMQWVSADITNQPMYVVFLYEII